MEAPEAEQQRRGGRDPFNRHAVRRRGVCETGSANLPFLSSAEFDTLLQSNVSPLLRGTLLVPGTLGVRLERKEHMHRGARGDGGEKDVERT